MSSKKRTDQSHEAHEKGIPPLMAELPSDDESGTDPAVAVGAEPAGGDELSEESRAESVAEVDLRPGYVAELERKLEAAGQKNLELETKVGQLLLSYHKAEEETQRIRERLERDRERRLQLDKQRLFRKLLDPLDNLERSLTAAKRSQDTSPLAVGVEMVWKQMQEHFQAMGLVRFAPAEEPFDPELHEALGVIPVPCEDGDGIVLRVEQPGYVLDGELLRPARVLVGQKTE